MKAFISYSHADQVHLTNLEKHLAQVKRDDLLDSWTDHAIKAGGNLNTEISEALNNSDIFIALVSPDYINSGYCYEKEFKYAQELQQQGKLKIVAVIVEPCDWLSTPFSDLKALPKDGKAISTWNNLNTALLDVVTNLRLLLNKEENEFLKPTGNNKVAEKYKPQRDFDSIEKMDFVSNGYQEIRAKLKKYINEVIEVEGIKARPIEDSNREFSYLLINRNKLNMEATLTISTADNVNHMMGYHGSGYSIKAEIRENNNQGQTLSFNLGNDEYELFWTDSQNHSFHNNQDRIVIQNIVDRIWNQWLHSIGINF